MSNSGAHAGRVDVAGVLGDVEALYKDIHRPPELSSGEREANPQVPASPSFGS